MENEKLEIKIICSTLIQSYISFDLIRLYFFLYISCIIYVLKMIIIEGPERK